MQRLPEGKSIWSLRCFVGLSNSASVDNWVAKIEGDTAPGSIPRECTGSCCHQCRAKMRRCILQQISSRFGMMAGTLCNLQLSGTRSEGGYTSTTQRSSTACLVTFFIHGRVYDWTAVEQKKLLPFSSLSHLNWWSMSMKVGCMDCDTCLLTLKAFAGPCMVYVNSFNTSLLEGLPRTDFLQRPTNNIMLYPPPALTRTLAPT